MAINTKEDLEESIIEMVRTHSDKKNAQALINATRRMIAARNKYMISMALNVVMIGLYWFNV